MLLPFRAFLFLSITIITGIAFKHFGLNLYFGFFAGICFQFVISYAVQQFLNVYMELKNKALDNERIKQFNYQSIEVSCPCHLKVKEVIPFRFNAENRYRCRECKKAISVFTETQTALFTEPLQDTDTTKPEILNVTTK